MGIFDRIFKKAEKKEPQDSSRMSLEEVERWAKDTSMEIQEDIVRELREAADEILRSKEEAFEIVEEIRDYKPPPEIKKRMYKPVLTTKPKYVKGMLDGLGTIRPMTEDTFEALVDFNKRTAKALKIIHRTQLNQGRIIATFFQDELPRLGTALNIIIDLQKSIEGGIKDQEKTGEQTSNINALVKELRNAINDEKTLKKDAKKARKEIKELEAGHAKYKEELEKFRKGSDYQKLAEKETELASVQEKLGATRSRGRNILGPLLRVLRKYARVANDKETKRITEAYIKSPQKSLFERPDGAGVITRILKEAIAMAERGELVIDKKELEKVENAVYNLGRIKEEHTSIKKEERRLKEVLASSDTRDEETAIKAELQNTKEEIERLKSVAKDAKVRAKEKKKEIKRLKDELQRDISKERDTDVVIEI